MNAQNRKVSSIQEEYLFQTFPLIHKTISHKLGSRHRDSVEDLKQKVFLKLWQWKATRSERDLSNEEWQKLANVAAHNEVTRFFSKKYTRDTLFSQMDERTKEAVFSIESFQQSLEGNSEAEIRSMLTLLWKGAQALSLRQKYVLMLQHSNLLIKFVTSGCCSIKELAAFFEATDEELQLLIDSCPLPDEKIKKLLEEKLGETITPNKIWEARSKAKAKLALFLKGHISNERSSVQRRT